MKVNKNLQDLYDDCYNSEFIKKDREITARQTIEHIQWMTKERKFENIVDIGAGVGSLIEVMSDLGMCSSISAVEISNSGIEEIKKRNIQRLKSIVKFDGYNIPYADQEFDLGVSTHVVEHVEHERMFLKEASRVCKYLYLEVPLEFTMNLDRSIRVSGMHGHINFYSRRSFDNLINTSGLVIEDSCVFYASLEREIFISNSKLIAHFKHQMRKNALKIFPELAPSFFVYMYGVLCKQKTP